MDVIDKATPAFYPFGIKDSSTRQLERTAAPRPTHCPIFFTYAQKGDDKARPVVGSGRDLIYGTDSFDLRKEFATHATPFMNRVNASSNVCMIQRLIPADALRANKTLWLDIIEVELPVYQRNSDGSLVRDVDGDPIPVTPAQTTIATKLKWVVKSYATQAEMQAKWAQETINNAGTMTEGATQSKQYPILSARGGFGKYYNNTGFRLWAPTALIGGLNENVLAQNVYPFRAAMVRRASATATAKIVESLQGEQSKVVAFKPGTIDTSTDLEVGFTETFLEAYSNTSDPELSEIFSDVEEFHFYENNWNTIAAMIAESEAAMQEEFSDFKTTDGVGEEYLVNLLSGEHSSGAPYSTITFDSGSLSLNQYTNIFLEGGADGTMSNDAYDDLVAEQMDAYIDPSNEVQDVAYRYESFIYDTGFKLSTKYQLMKFAALRKDTFVWLSVHQHGMDALDKAEEHAIGVALKTRAEFYGESETFGTKACRFAIMGRSCRIRNSQWRARVPLTYVICGLNSDYMGASNGIWKTGFDFDGGPNHIVTDVYDVSEPWSPLSMRHQDWAIGLNYALRFDRGRMFIPALKTVYSEDTSVLTGYFAAVVACEINKVLDACWRYYSGVQKYTSAQLVERVRDFMNENLQNRFDNRFVIVPEPTITTIDNNAGFSWTVPVKVYAPNMKTVEKGWVEMFRRDDLPSTATN